MDKKTKNISVLEEFRDLLNGIMEISQIKKEVN